MASCLDPRFKMEFISADNKPRVKDKVASEMMECQEEMTSCSTEVEHEVAETSHAKKAKKSLGSFFKLSGAAANGDSSVTLKDAVDAELSNYLTPSIDKEQDPLAWWKTHSVSFPHLAKLACKYLSIPATSSPSERVFSASGNIITCQHSSLKPAMVDRLVFLAKNLFSQNLIFVFYDDQHLFYLSTVAQKSQLNLFYFINHSGGWCKTFFILSNVLTIDVYYFSIFKDRFVIVE